MAVPDRRRIVHWLAAGAILLAAALLPAAAVLAQRVVFQQPLQFEGDPGVDLGTGDPVGARSALLARADATWVVGRRDDPGEDELYVQRIAPDGAVLLERALDLGGADYGLAVAPAEGTDVYIGAQSRLAGENRIVLLRLATDGRIVWRFDLPNPGLWRDLFSDLSIAVVDGSSLVLASTAIAIGSETTLVQLARVEDRGGLAQLGWQSTLQPGTGGIDSLGIAPSPDGTRIAVGAAARGATFERRPFLALVNAANGGLVTSTLDAGTVNGMLAPRFAPDGSIRLVAESSASRGVRLLRFSPAGAFVGATDGTCGASICRPGRAVITSDGATVVAAQDFGSNAALLYRFAADGSQQWVRTYTAGEFSRIPALLPAGTAVDIVVSSRLVDADSLSERWLPARIDAAGQPATAVDLPQIDADGSEVVTMARAPDDTLWIASSIVRERGSIRVGRYTPGSTGLDALVAPRVGPLPVQQFGFARLLQRDPDGRPVVAFEVEGNGRQGIGARGFDAGGVLRWSLLSDPASRERSPALTIDPAGRIGLASIAGGPTASQLALRRLDADGAPSGPVQFIGESGAITPFAAAAADGTRAVAFGTVDGDIVVRLTGVDGAQRWRTGIPTGVSFTTVTGLGFLGDGDVVVLYAAGFDADASLRVQRLARADGSAAAPLIVPANGFASVVAFATLGQRVFAALETNLTRVLIIDVGAGGVVSVDLGPSSTAKVRDLVLSADGTRLYAAGTRYDPEPRPRLLARDATTGGVILDVTVADGAPGEGRAALLRGNDVVLVAERSPDPNRGSEGAELSTIAPDGTVLSRASINAGPRLAIREARYDPATDRAWLLGNAVAPDGTLAPTVLGVAFDAPARIFADGFE